MSAAHGGQGPEQESIPQGAGSGALGALEVALPGAIHTRAIDRLARAHDASHYLLEPRAVAVPRNALEIGALMRSSAAHGMSLTFRSGGTSLSGQASTDGILVDTRRHFRSIEVLNDGALVRAQPGATVRAVNARLARLQRKLGPDPASEIACTIGGVVANNSSGMACGVERNTYRTLHSAVVVLASGTVLDTGAADADAVLQQAEPAIHEGLLGLRSRILSNPDSVASIARQYAIKNTMGYGLNSFVDFERPVDMLEHLMIGSEGTLGFIAEATFRTEPLHAHAATSLLLFDSLMDAVASLPALAAASFATIELLDSASLRVAQQGPTATPELRALRVRSHAALLVEFQQPDAAGLRSRIATAEQLFAELPIINAVALSTDTAVRAQLWRMRKGLYAAVAGGRPPGTTALLEDIAVPAHRLLDTCGALTELLQRHGYEDSVIFGHAKDGNLHFLLNEQFHRPEKLRRYEAFTNEMVDLVLGNDGSLKAEHGTGRIMAPYVERQYGSELFAVMQETKRLFDPHAQLNPGVLISNDPRSHLKHLKTVEPVEAEVDRCVECGYCEPACPSADLTLTPRQRIAIRRDIAAAKTRGDVEQATALSRDYVYDGIETCAVDGVCADACPLGINTGNLVRRLREETVQPAVNRAWRLAARHWAGATRIAGLALSTAKLAPRTAAFASRMARAVVRQELVPEWTVDLPGGGSPRQPHAHPAATAVFFPSCTSSMFGPAGDGGGVTQAFYRLCERAGIAIRTPENIASLCCGTPWKSKGLADGYAVMRDLTWASLLRATDNGRLPIVCDASSCTEGLQALLASSRPGEPRLTVIDAVQFAAQEVLPRLPAFAKLPSIAVHPTCSSGHIGSNPALFTIARRVAEQVTVPEDWGCCAFAGDRGMLHPELTRSATAREATEVGSGAHGAHASVNRTCEIAMTRATGFPYANILEVLDLAVSGESRS